MNRDVWKKRLDQSIENDPESTGRYLLLNKALEDDIEYINGLVQKQGYHPKGLKGTEEKIQKYKEYFVKIDDLDKQIHQEREKEKTRSKFNFGLSQLREITEPTQETKEHLIEERRKQKQQELQKREHDAKMEQLHPKDPAAAGADVRIQEEIKAEEIRQQKIQEELKRAQEARERMKKGRDGFEI